MHKTCIRQTDYSVGILQELVDVVNIVAALRWPGFSLFQQCIESRCQVRHDDRELPVVFLQLVKYISWAKSNGHSQDKHVAILMFRTAVTF